jgi:hypothetical protein
MQMWAAVKKLLQNCACPLDLGVFWYGMHSV